MFRKLIFIMMLGATAQASELTHEFGNPAFSGNGYSQHVLSIEQLQYSRKNDVKDAQKSAAAAAKRKGKANKEGFTTTERAAALTETNISHAYCL